MAINIVKVESHKQLKAFVAFPLRLYKGCANWVPALEGDEYDTFNPEKNGAYDFCEADCFLAYRGDEIVGRVAAIINHKADDEQQLVRFGWLDFIEDEEVLKALIDTVAEWGRQRGRKEMRGPWGFTDMDKEGLLVEGYEHLSPFTCLYNFPYYGPMLEKLGFTKDVDWTQRVLEVSSELPPMFQFANLIEERFKVHVVQPKSMKDMSKRYGMQIFHMYNEAFAPLHGFSPLTDKQIEAYLKTYVPILDKDFVALAVNDKDEPIGFVFCVPSLSKAVKKSNGRLFPFGFINILKALKKNDTLEALIMGVMPEYQQCGIPVLLFKYLHENCIKRNINRIIMNPQLEENYKVQSLFGEYKTIPFMRRRAFKKVILSLMIVFSFLTGWAQKPLLTSQWTQNYPYNQFCPRDPVNNYALSYAGCPAIAMGQIINYLQTTQGTRFTDDDDYDHRYAGRNYRIDDDWASLQFPSFPQLNEMLDSVDATFERGEELSNLLAAAVVFACGTACTQIYTSEGSGTFTVDQAYAAYQRFGFKDCLLFRDPDSIMYATLISNLKDGYPAHLAVENPAGTVGHNVVVDGYREEDGKFHINFGYGGTLDNWYDIPDPNFYYGMTKVEGIILNIIPESAPSAIHETTTELALEVYPNPVSDVLYLKDLANGQVEYSIFNVLGQKVAEGSTSGAISVATLEKGVYYLQINGEKRRKAAKIIVK